jgi:glycosyltransferase involved in cell wall biosynthesis
MPSSKRPQTALFLQATDASAYPPTLHMQALMLARGWQVICLNSPIAQSALKMPMHARLQTINLPERKSFVMSKKDYLRYVWHSFQLIAKIRPHVIVYADPNACPLVYLPTRAIRVYQEHDTPASLGSLRTRARIRMLKLADYVLFPNAERAAFVQQQTNFDLQKLRILWNLPMRTEISAKELKTAGAASTERPLVLYYHGSINAERLPISIVEAIKALGGRVHLRIAGYEVGKGGYVASLQAIAPAWVRYLGEFATRAELFAQMQGADVGLALMPMHSDDLNMRAMTGASNKAFDYMAAGLAMIVSQLPDWQSMFVAPGFALNCDPREVRSVQSVLEQLLAAPDLLQKMKRYNLEKIQNDWHFEQPGNVFIDELEAEVQTRRLL